MIANLFVVLFLSLGIGAAIPLPLERPQHRLGFMAFGGFCLLTVLLFLFIVVLELGFDLTFKLLVATAIAGSVSVVFRERVFQPPARLLIHPVVLFPVLIAILAVFEGPLRFLPYDDDTYSNWLIHAKQLWLADSYHADNLVSGAVGYAPGWHLLMAFSSPVWGDFSDTRVLGLSTAAHIAMLGLIFDITVIWLNRVNGVTSVAAQSAGGLTVILLALAAEASWQLVPTLILPEMPLFYTLIGSFASCLLFGIKGCRRLRLSFFVSLSLCCHFLIKSQGLAALPAIVVIGFLFNSGRFDYRNTGRNLVHVAILTGPAIGALLAWKALGPDSSKCVANLGEIFSSASAQIDGGSHWATLLTDVLVTSGNYVLTYKFPLVLIAGSGILLGLFDPKLRPVGLLVLLYTAVYLLAVFWMYLSCPHSFGVYMSSILRYLQLPVRVIHTLGLLMLFFMTLRLVLSRFASDIVVFMNRAFLVTALVAGAYQVTQVKASFFEINHPTAEKRIQTIPSDVEAVLTTTQKQGLHYPRVLMVYTFWELLPFLVALHNGLPTSRDELPGNGELSRWNLEHVRFQNIDAPAPAGGEVLSPEFFTRFDVIWATDDVRVLSEELAGLVENEECSATPSKFLLIRRPSQSPEFECIRRNPLSVGHTRHNIGG